MREVVRLGKLGAAMLRPYTEITVGHCTAREEKAALLNRFSSGSASDDPTCQA